jgi:peptide deformylase
MIKPILTLPNNKLRQKSDEVINFDKNLGNLIADLSDTLQIQTDPPGLGLSAPQIGISKRVFVAIVRNKTKAFVNPRILKLSPNQIALLEGCFSVPELYGHVTRPAEIDLEAYDKQGKKVKGYFKGLAARIIQHEIDHLNGILFVDHIHNQNGKLFKVEKDKKGKDQLIEIAYV